ncbi:Kinase-like protein [Actinidia chinensis var. chinensis]|uniref:Kinase-like protein n=1 Tax=Actinidia chinensis var. chinensis TaxID=1590841 RepID=A0A2R6S1I1_ACTCC|nr:Kinase-like protein [Actinidia chinensis var. chinensis]
MNHAFTSLSSFAFPFSLCFLPWCFLLLYYLHHLPRHFPTLTLSSPPQPPPPSKLPSSPSNLDLLLTKNQVLTAGQNREPPSIFMLHLCSSLPMAWPQMGLLQRHSSPLHRLILPTMDQSLSLSKDPSIHLSQEPSLESSASSPPSKASAFPSILSPEPSLSSLDTTLLSPTSIWVTIF